MEPRIETVAKKILIGERRTMSLSHDTTRLLWKGFMPRLNEVTNRCGTDLFSLQVYDENYFERFDPEKLFVKWAAVEVMDQQHIPSGMEAFILSTGLYAVFFHKGHPSDTTIFRYIFSAWLPNSAYLIDNRPHFEVLGARYKNGDPLSEEEIWIPIKPKRS